jgi:hypothetical protein
MKKYHDIEYIVINKYINFHNEICRILNSAKITNFGFTIGE